MPLRERPLHRVGSAKKDLIGFPDEVVVVYVVRLEKAIYVLHCFQKKSPKGIETAKPDVELVSRRLKAAKEDYEVRYGKKA